MSALIAAVFSEADNRTENIGWLIERMWRKQQSTTNCNKRWMYNAHTCAWHAEWANRDVIRNVRVLTVCDGIRQIRKSLEPNYYCAIMLCTKHVSFLQYLNHFILMIFFYRNRGENVKRETCKVPTSDRWCSFFARISLSRFLLLTHGEWRKKSNFDGLTCSIQWLFQQRRVEYTARYSNSIRVVYQQFVQKITCYFSRIRRECQA